MKKLLLAGVLSLILLFFGCGGSGDGGSSGESATIKKTSSVLSNQYGKAVFGKATLE
jgi:hypothetical protein